jgi:predicted PurR-regulated permease PerM
VTVTVIHLVAVNLLTPRIVGRRVKLSAISVTLALMFWGWLWGGVGLLLAIPITAAFKAVCDNVTSLKPLGTWLGET